MKKTEAKPKKKQRPGRPPIPTYAKGYPKKKPAPAKPKEEKYAGLRGARDRFKSDDWMDDAEAMRTTGGLTKTSAMPGWSYSLPALKTCGVGSKLASIPNSPCAVCYATRNFYRMPNVVAAQQRRLEAVKVAESFGWEKWTRAIVQQIRAVSYATPESKFFRWHDSGDVISWGHLLAIVEVARRLPHVRFWLPTKEYALVRRLARECAELPENLCVRVSMALFDEAPPTQRFEGRFPWNSAERTPGALAGTGSPCQKPVNKQKTGVAACGSCRACWSNEVENVVLEEH